MQVWRPLKGPVKEAPLAVVDARSVSPRSLHTVKLVFPHRVGHTYTVGYDPGELLGCAHPCSVAGKGRRGRGAVQMMDRNGASKPSNDA